MLAFGDDLWKFLEAMLVPCLIVAAPFAAVVMRLMQAEAVDQLETDYVRTAEVQGLALWGAVLIVTMSVLADVVLVTLDPRVR